MFRKLLLACLGDMSISDRILLVTYMGTPLERALPLKQRLMVKVFSNFIKYKD